jgi:hypothetical protein
LDFISEPTLSENKLSLQAARMMCAVFEEYAEVVSIESVGKIEITAIRRLHGASRDMITVF